MSLPLMVDFTRREVVPGALAAVQEAGALERSPLRDGQRGGAAACCATSRPRPRIGLTWVEGTEPPLALLAELGAEYWNPMFAFITPEGVAACMMPISSCPTWTVDTEADMARMVHDGVDAVVSNQVAALVAIPAARTEARHRVQRPRRVRVRLRRSTSAMELRWIGP